MRIEHAQYDNAKGWYAGPWNSNLAFSVGYANEGIDEPHVHTKITEVYLIARGTSTMQIEQETIKLEAGDVVIIEPGEAHTFVANSPDYFHFVFHVPSFAGEEARAEKLPVPRSRLGLCEP